MERVFRRLNQGDGMDTLRPYNLDAHLVDDCSTHGEHNVQQRMGHGHMGGEDNLLYS